MKRVQQDLRRLLLEPIVGIVAMPDQGKVNVCHALILGPANTPYQHGFFLFKMDFPDDYPYSPPRVTFLTTAGGVVRFNPNLYACGRVCLSILGTWNGPGWTSAQSIGSVLLSIQSLLNANPYCNEPGYEKVPIESEPVQLYNHFIVHETMRVAVLDVLDLVTTPGGNQHVSPMLAIRIRNTFSEMVEFYKLTCDEYSFLNGQSWRDPFSSRHGKFDFAALRRRLEEGQEKFETAREMAAL
jgi:ubiquitin-conjugating enzyme E2 Z